MKTSKLMYTLIFWLYVINGIVPLLLLFGFDWLTNMSMYMIYFSLNVQINIIYILVKFLLIATTILLIKYVNKKIKIETKSEDDKLEDNPTIPKYYDKFKVDYICIIPLLIDLGIGLLSYFGIGSNVNKYIIFIILIGIAEICFSVFILYNKIKYAEFFVKQNK